MTSVSTLYYQETGALFTASEDSRCALNPPLVSPISAYFTLSSVFPTILEANRVTEKKRERGFLSCFPSPLFPVNSGRYCLKKSGELIKSPSRLLAGVSLQWPCFLQRRDVCFDRSLSLLITLCGHVHWRPWVTRHSLEMFGDQIRLSKQEVTNREKQPGEPPVILSRLKTNRFARDLIPYQIQR